MEVTLNVKRFDPESESREPYIQEYNLDVEDYVDRIPTGENIVRLVCDLLDGRIPGAALHKVRLVETRDNAFEYGGEDR